MNMSRTLGWASLALAAVLAAPQEASAQYAVEITANSLNVRTQAWGTVLGAVAQGDRFMVDGTSNGWLQISFRGRRAFIHANYARRISAVYVRVDASSLNVRTGPSTRYTRIGAVASPQRYVRLSGSSGWSKIQYDHRTAWAHDGYLTLAAASGAQPMPTPNRPAPQPTPSPTRPNPSPSGSLSGVRIAFDVGHGQTTSSWDPGATNSRNGVREYDLNLLVGQTAKRHLEAMGATVSLFYYPPGAQRLSLSSKGRRGAGHHIFVSLHHNAFNGSAQGTETLIHTGGSSQDQRLATYIQNAMMPRIWGTSTGRMNRGVKRQGLGVLRGVPSSVRACCLVEGFFVDPSNITRSVANDMATREAAGVAEGIARYWANR